MDLIHGCYFTSEYTTVTEHLWYRVESCPVESRGAKQGRGHKKTHIYVLGSYMFHSTVMSEHLSLWSIYPQTPL